MRRRSRAWNSRRRWTWRLTSSLVSTSMVTKRRLVATTLMMKVGGLLAPTLMMMMSARQEDRSQALADERSKSGKSS